MVFTLYDGFYMYSTYANTLDDETDSRIPATSTYQNGERVEGLRPYVYYSCRYKKSGTNLDVTITYSLDNYITVQGYDKNGTPINDAGYIIDVNKISIIDDDTLMYRGTTIEPEPALKEYLGKNEYPCIKINGIKYYYINDTDTTDGTDDTGWYYILNGDLTRALNIDGYDPNSDNTMAYRYYKEAYDFWDRLQGYGITTLNASNAVDKNGDQLTHLEDEDGNIIYDFTGGDIDIFDNDGIEEPDSNFNEHRLAVIRYVIEKNLSVALANYNNGKYNFRMPKLSEEDWTRILNNVSLISFMQGLSIGGKIYNGYSVINNNENDEVVTENSIYIVDSNNTYHRNISTDINTSGNLIGIFNNNFEVKIINPDTEFERLATDVDRRVGELVYYYPRQELGCYGCYVTLQNNASSTNIYEYMDNLPTDKAKIRTAYYTALGRERYSMYKSQRDREKHIEDVVGTT